MTRSVGRKDRERQTLAARVSLENSNPKSRVRLRLAIAVLATARTKPYSMGESGTSVAHHVGVSCKGEP